MTAPLMPGGESTSARLRRVEQERDELAQRVTALERERAAWDRHHVEVVRQRDQARAELVSARAELEQLRARLAATTTHPTEGES
jgi:chromosome segregation ATPase